jgi:uncharacterized protein HemY
MTANLQTIIVGIIILCALLYVLRRVVARLIALGGRAKAADAPTCATGCGKCGGSE